ncbi:MAG TPA: Ig-like domain-containing protein [Gemmatimonadales bacterium]|nr:Ig-like domain-containing protein [Gemmatimonadales bacterium]
MFLVALAACAGDSGVTGPATTSPESPSAPVTALSVTPGSKTLVIGETLALSITAKDNLGLPCDCKPTYASSAVQVATISAVGVVTGLAEGSATIKVTCIGGVSAEVRITVVANVAVPLSVTIAPELKTLAVGGTVQLSVAAKDINGLPCDCKPTYSSADPAIATVSATGLVTAKAAGEVWITVSCVGGVSAKAKIIVSAELGIPAVITISPDLKNLLIGESVQLSLTVKDKLGLPCACNPTYISADIKIATVSSTGLVTAKAAGEVWITVICSGGLSARVKIIVTAVASTVSLDPVLSALKIGANIQLKVVAKDINGLPCDCKPTYSSADPAIATVSATGLVTAKAAGEVWITVSCVGGVSVKVKITVLAKVATISLSPASVTLKIGSTLQLSVVAKDIEGLPVDCICTFESLDPLLAKVTGTGLVTGLLIGLVEVRATCEGITAKSTISLINL